MKNGEKILIVEMCKKVKMIVRIKKKKQGDGKRKGKEDGRIGIRE